MTSHYKPCIAIFTVLMIVSILALILNNFFVYKMGLLNIYLWIAFFAYITGISAYIIANLGYIELETDNPIKALLFTQDYYDKVGYSLFTSGLVIIFVSSNLFSSIGLIIVGISFIIISIIKKGKVEKFKEENSK